MPEFNIKKRKKEKNEEKNSKLEIIQKCSKTLQERREMDTTGEVSQKFIQKRDNSPKLTIL